MDRTSHSETPFLEMNMDWDSSDAFEMKFFIPSPEYVIHKDLSIYAIANNNRFTDINDGWRVVSDSADFTETLDGI